MNLKNQVPELELCRDIPHGCFGDSYFIFVPLSNGKEWKIMKRTTMLEASNRIVYSAPTLPEIMAEIGKHREAPTVYWTGAQWTVECEAVNCIEQNRFEDKKNPANAAMKLWLEVTKDEVEE